MKTNIPNGETTAAKDKERQTATGRDNLPETITIVADSLTILNAVHGRGDVLTVDDDLVKATTDRDGATFLTLADDEAAQIATWGRPMFVSGDRAKEIRAADDLIEEERERVQAAIDDASGLEALRQGWDEDRLWRDNGPRVAWKSRTISTRPVT